MSILVTAQVNASSKFIGLAIVFTAGACYSIFSPAFNLSTNDQWHKLAPGVDKLVIYTAFFYFSLAFFGCAILINVCFLYKPAFGVPKSSIGAYLKDWNGRWIALLAGVLCGWGNGFQFMGGQAAGYAAADAVQVIACGTLAHVPVFAQEAGHVTGALVCIFAVLMSSLPTFSALPSPAPCPALPCPALPCPLQLIVLPCLLQLPALSCPALPHVSSCTLQQRLVHAQALPLVSTFWGVVIFGEYRRATTKTYILLGAMLCMFAAAVGLLMGSSGTRKN